ncbi:MAG: FG-GAP repeat domain-containing protein, partial [Candidatus Heimdallarchaeaceae archaeon]
VVYENTGNENSVVFTQIVIANFSFDYYGATAFISDIVIADLDGTGNNSILVGTRYYTTDYFGDVVSFNKTNNVWQEEDFLNGGNAIQGGVYSLDVGEVGPSSENLVVVGQGFPDTLDNCNVTIYKKVIDNWIEEEVIQTYQSRIRVSIGNFTSDFDGNEILYCSTSDNCTLGYVVYDSGVTQHTTFGGFPGWYNERFNWMDMGDLNGDGLDEAVVSVKRTMTIDTDSIEIYNGFPNISLYSGFYLINNEFVVNDFDNDGRDEVVFIHTTSITYPDVQIMYIDWNGTAYETHTIENTIEPNIPSIAVGDVDTDGVLELLYGTDGNGWLRLLDWIIDEFTDEYVIAPVVSLIEGIFNITCTVRTYAWGIQGISVTLDLPAAINSTTPSTTIVIGDKLGPSTTKVQWQVDPLSYGIYGIGAETTTSNVGMNATTLNVTITDLDVQNVLSSSLIAEIGSYITLSGEVVFIHDGYPVEDAEVFIDGTSVSMTDPSGHFSFQHTEASTGLKNHNITATLENGVKITKCAGYKIIQIEWTATVPEFGNLLYLSLLLPISAASILLVIKKERKKL